MRTTASLLAFALILGSTAFLGCSDSDDETTSSGPGSGASGGSGGAGASGGTGTTGGGTSNGGSGGVPIEPDDPPVLTESASPVDGIPAGVTFYDAVPYGPEDGQTVDFFMPDSAEPTAVIFFIHGGGFTGGSSDNAYDGGGANVKSALEAGIAFASVDYRLLKDPGVEDQGVIKSLDDSKRCLQFVRRWADSFHIDPTRVGLTGGSAGAGTSLWLAYHDDMADPDSPNPWQQQSTRVTVAAVNSTQATYDTWRWAADIFAPTYPYVTNELLLTQPELRAMLVRFYGLDGALVDDADALQAALETDELKAYRANVDMLALLTSDDPDTYVTQPAPNAAPTDADFDLLHHPLHAMAVRDAADAAGTVFEADIPAFDVETSASLMPFLIERLGK